jgi:predicted dehydrogenase
MYHFGIIGAGNIAHKFIEAVRMTKNADVTAVASKSLERARDWAEKEGLSRYYDSYETLLADPDIDIIYIATLSNAHYDNIKACLEAGKHVICEKPMTQTASQAQEMITLAREKQLFLMEGMWSRFLPKSLRVRRWIQEGRIGELHLMQANIGWKADKTYNKRLFYPELGGGSLYDIGIYPMELLPYYADQKITQMQFLKKDYSTGVDDIVSLNLQLERCIANIQCSFTTKMPEDAYLYGSDGYIHIPKIHFGNRARLYDLEDRLVEDFHEGLDNGFYYEVCEVISCIEKGQTESSICPLNMTYDNAKLFDHVLRFR